MDQQQRDRIVGLCRELNQIADDLRIATGVLIDYEDGHNKHGRFLKLDALPGLNRMCVGWMALALSRFDQLLDPFWNVIPAPEQAACAAIRSEISRRKVMQYRGSIVAHPFDGKGGPLLLPSETNRRFVEGLGKGDPMEWHQWISPRPNDENPEPGVVAKLHDIRDGIARFHGISTEELIESLSK